jgi:toxin ParE1/3/4
MIYHIQVTYYAEKDLRDIYEYIAFTLLEPGTAVEQLDRIEKAILSLDELPERFRLVGYEPWYSRGIRQIPVDNFIVFYVINTDEKIVSIIRVMYGRRDISKQLNIIE